MKEKIEEYALFAFRTACFVLGAIFVVSIVTIVARFAYMLMLAQMCIKAG